MNEIEQERLFYPPVGVIKPQTSKVMPDYVYIHPAFPPTHNELGISMPRLS